MFLKWIFNLISTCVLNDEGYVNIINNERWKLTKIILYLQKEEK